MDMKHRAVLLVFLFGINFAALQARAGYTPPNSGPVKNNPFQNLTGGRDVATTEWQSWQAPGAGPVDPNRLVPGDGSTNSGSLKVFSESRLDSLFGTSPSLPAKSLHGGDAKVEIVKPIEKVAPRTESPTYNAQPIPVVPRKSDTKRIVLIALVCVGILAYRKFRRPSTVPWKKPSFL